MLVLMLPVRVFASDNCISEFKDTKSSGFIEVVKSWFGVDTDRSLPEICISGSKPTKNPLGYTVYFDEGSLGFDDKEGRKYELLYTGNGTVLNGNYSMPVIDSDVGKFLGWKNSSDTIVNISSEGVIPKKDLKDCMSLTASYEFYPRVAMAVWGIEQDTDINGNVMGLTFGPAVSDKYQSSKYGVYHEPSGTTDNGNKHRCIHTDSWDDIVNWNKVDPYVYEQCIDNDCSKCLCLDWNKAKYLFPHANTYYKYVGDGDLSGVYAYISYNKNSADVWKYYDSDVNTILGWENCTIRYLLNGSEGGKDVKCLLDCFPSVLSDGIGLRKSDCAYYPSRVDGMSDYVYDRLFMFSLNEFRNTFSRGDHFTFGGVYGSSFPLRDIYSNSDRFLFFERGYFDMYPPSVSSRVRYVAFGFSLSR